MPNLWDIPQKPEHGDNSPDLTFAAVGRALSTWERLDLEFAVLYATLLGISPPEAIKLPEYRNENTFLGRVGVIERAFDTYSVKHHDQAIEGDADALFTDAPDLSNRRNDIAHGIVVPLWLEQNTDEFVLLPAMYRDKRFNPSGEPDYTYSSVEINAFERNFERTIPRCVRLHCMIGQGIDPYPELQLSPPHGL